MGRIRGSIEAYDRDELGLVPPELELLNRLVDAYPRAVPYDRCCHLSTGVWAGPDRAGCVAHDVRRKLGRGFITTVTEVGYRAGPDLLRILTDRSPSRRIGPWAWTSSTPHRGRQELIAMGMSAACRMAVGL